MDVDSDTAIKVEHVSKTFKLPHEKATTIKGALINFTRHKRGYENRQVLHDVSFEVKKGEFFGIVGRNGSGKSTLLKLLAGIYNPNKGNILINGKLTPFIELGVGFNPELTGRENVYLNGSLLGFNRREMKDMYGDIVNFAELDKFMDLKLKNYSSGMQVRLAFSIAVRARNEILLLDEVLAVGDANFQQKCFDYFYKLKLEKKTIIFVSHDMDSIQKFCDRAIVMNDGKVIFLGPPSQAAVLYKEENFPIDLEKDETNNSDTKSDKLKIEITDDDGKPKRTFTSGETMAVNISWKKDPNVQFLGVAVHRDDGMYIFGTNNQSKSRAVAENQNKSKYSVELSIGSGQYYVEVAIFGNNESNKVFYTAHGPSFVVHNTKQWQGVTELKYKWSI